MPQIKYAERALRISVQRAVSGLGARWFRQNVGLAWQGERIVKTGDSVYLEHARPVRAGLCEGSSDLIGWTPVRITPEMVGQTVAVFTAAELKTAKQNLTEEQATFLEAVQKAGGIAGVVRSTADGVALARKLYRGV